MKKTRIVILALLVCMTFVLAACGQTSSQKDDSSMSQDTVSSSKPENEDTKPQEDEDQPEAGNTGSDESGNTLAMGTYPDGSKPQLSGVRVRLTVNGEDEVIIAMYDNTAADAFLERMPITGLEFYDLSGIEKPARVLEEEFSLGEEEPGYDPTTGEMVIYRPWGNFTIFYGDFRHSNELVPLGIVESGLEIIAGQTEDFTGVMEILEE